MLYFLTIIIEFYQIHYGLSSWNHKEHEPDKGPITYGLVCCVVVKLLNPQKCLVSSESQTWSYKMKTNSLHIPLFQDAPSFAAH